MQRDKKRDRTERERENAEMVFTKYRFCILWPSRNLLAEAGIQQHILKLDDPKSDVRWRLAPIHVKVDEVAV